MFIQSRPAPGGRVLTRNAPPAFTSRPMLNLGRVRHGFFGREGGVSEGIYASLNAGPGSRDDPAAVAENRARIAAAFGAPPDKLLSLHQVHSARALRVDRPWTGPRPEADALVTTTPGLVLTALSADCAPVLLADAQAGVVAAAHAGWKGALGGVLEAAVAEMQAAGAEPARIVAVIGPCIRQGSYEVGPEFVQRFLDQDAGAAAFFKPGPSNSSLGDRSRFDLPGFCVSRLQRLGLNRTDALPLDTYSDETAFFSHRRSVHENSGDYGRNCAAICLSSL